MRREAVAYYVPSKRVVRARWRGSVGGVEVCGGELDPAELPAEVRAAAEETRGEVVAPLD